VVEEEPFAVLLADDLIDARVPVMKQMVELVGRRDASAIGVMEVAPSDIGSYGIVETGGGAIEARARRIRRIVEKPRPGTSPSNLAVVGRYVLSSRIFHHLRTMPPGTGGEIQLTDAIARLLAEQPVLAYSFEGRRYDCGSKLGYLEATVELGVKHPEVGSGFLRFLSDRSR